jgi:hypothetical protein
MNIRKKSILFATLVIHVFGYGQTDSTQQLSLACNDQQFYAQTTRTNGECFAQVSLLATGFENGSCKSKARLYWNIYVDLYNNGTYDYELSSFLEVNDNNLNNDSNHNGINDVYVAPTLSGEKPSLPLIHLDYERGVNSVKWEVRDSCGNRAVCFSNFFIVDRVSPTIQLAETDTLIMGRANDEITAIEFDRGSTDNCANSNGLIFTFDGAHPILSQLSYEHYFKGSGEEANQEEYQRGRAQRWLPAQRTSVKMIPCFDALNSPKLIAITAWDAELNSATDTITLTIDASACEPYTIFGDLVNLKNHPIEKVNVTIGANHPEYPKSAEWSGQYHFFASYGSFEIKPTKTDDYSYGVNVADALAIYHHIQDIKKLETPEQLLAADINQDAQITEKDLTELWSLISGQTNTFINNDSWIFLPSPYSFKDKNHPYDIERTAMVDLAVQTHQDFTGIKVGDVDQSTVDPKDDEIVNTIALTTDDRWIQRGEEVVASFWMNDKTEVQGWEINWQVNGLSKPQVVSLSEILYESTKVDDGNSFHTYAVLNKCVSIKKEGEIFSIKGRAERDGMLSSFLGLEEVSTIYTDTIVTDNKVSLSYFTPREERQFEMYPCTPNPFAIATEIRYYLPAPGEVQCFIYNAGGQLIWTQNHKGNGGRNYFEIKSDDLSLDGLYYLTIQYRDQVQTQPLILGR